MYRSFLRHLDTSQPLPNPCLVHAAVTLPGMSQGRLTFSVCNRIIVGDRGAVTRIFGRDGHDVAGGAVEGARRARRGDD